MSQRLPSTLDVLPTKVLVCPHCHVVNFPGVDKVSSSAASKLLMRICSLTYHPSVSIQTLAVRRGTRMFSVTGARLRPEEYQGAVEHVASSCKNPAIAAIDVALPCKTLAALPKLVRTQVAAMVREPWWAVLRSSGSDTEDEPRSEPTETLFPSPLPFPPIPLSIDAGAASPASAAAPASSAATSAGGGAGTPQKGKGKASKVSNRALFERELVVAAWERRAAFFHLLGQLVAQALLDGRLLDLPLATPFLRALVAAEAKNEVLRQADAQRKRRRSKHGKHGMRRKHSKHGSQVEAPPRLAAFAGGPGGCEHLVDVERDMKDLAEVCV